MRKSLLVGFVILLIVGFSPNARATLTPGTYDLISLLGNGSWDETLNGAHGVPGNSIIATGPGWTLTGTLQSVASAADPWQYQTAYQITFALTVPGPWGEAVQIFNVPGTNLSRRDASGNLEWEFTFTGYDAQNPSIPIYGTAHFDSIPPTTPSGGVLYYNDNQTLHGGGPLSDLKMQIAPIPPSAWFLASGLLGLIAVRRRSR